MVLALQGLGSVKLRIPEEVVFGTSKMQDAAHLLENWGL